MEKIGIGVLLIVLAFIGGGHEYILSWGSAELVGRNVFTLLMVFGGIYLINRGRKSKPSSTTQSGQ